MSSVSMTWIRRLPLVQQACCWVRTAFCWMRVVVVGRRAARLAR